MQILELGESEAITHMGGHQGVLEERRILGAHRRSHIDIAAIGDVDMSTEHTEQAGGTCVLIVGDPLAQRYALHGFRYGDIEEL